MAIESAFFQIIQMSFEELWVAMPEHLDVIKLYSLEYKLLDQLGGHILKTGLLDNFLFFFFCAW